MTSPAQPSRTEREDARDIPTLETRVEALATLAWKARDDAARSASMARHASELAASERAGRRVSAFGMVAQTRAAVLADDLETVVRVGQAALGELDGPRDWVWHGRLLQEVANAESKLGHYAEAKAACERGLQIAREHGPRGRELHFLVNLGMLDSATGQTEQALATLLEARALAARSGEGRWRGLALVNLGALYRALGAYPEATTSLLQGIERLEPHQAQEHIATAYCTLSTIHAVTGRFEEALVSAREGLARFPEGEQTWATANAFGAVGFAHLQAGEYDAALEAMNRSLQIRRSLGVLTEVAAGVLVVGDIHLKAGRLDEAEASYREGLGLMADFDEPRIDFGCEAGLAQVLEARGDTRGALALAEPLIARWERIGEKSSLAEALDLVARLQERIGDSVAALATLKRARALQQELFNRESSARLQHLQVTHEVAREREKTAAALSDLTRHVMEAHEAERRRVARDLHDDLSQRLALLAVQLDVLSRTPPATTDELRVRFGTLADSVRVVEDHVHRISHQLHPATLEQLGLVAALRSDCEEVAQAYGIDIAFHSDELLELPDEIELGCYRIVQEVLRNAVRHGRTKSIAVRLFEDAEGICVQVRDEGVGFDPDAPASTGLGLIGMRERTEHLGGCLTIRSAVGRGTFVEVSVPRPPGRA